MICFFLHCNISNFADDTKPYVCDKNLNFVMRELEQQSNIPLKGLKIIIWKWMPVNVVSLSQGTNMNIYGLKQVMIKFGNLEQLSSLV